VPRSFFASVIVLSHYGEKYGVIIFTPGRHWPSNDRASGEIYKEISQIHAEAVIAPVNLQGMADGPDQRLSLRGSYICPVSHWVWNWTVCVCCASMHWVLHIQSVKLGRLCICVYCVTLGHVWQYVYVCLIESCVYSKCQIGSFMYTSNVPAPPQGQKHSPLWNGLGVTAAAACYGTYAREISLLVLLVPRGQQEWRQHYDDSQSACHTLGQSAP